MFLRGEKTKKQKSKARNEKSKNRLIYLLFDI